MTGFWGNNPQPSEYIKLQARKRAESAVDKIENISRKKMIKSILDGVEPDFSEVKSYCGEELIDANGGEVRRIGFQSNS